MALKRQHHKTPGPQLSRLELEVMDVVWDLGECTSAQVIEAFCRKRRLAPTTIRTVLASLRKKGYMEAVPTIERGFRLRATVARDAVARGSLRRLLGSLFKGSPREVVACLLDDAELSDEELDEIRRMIEARKQKGGRS
ncbi:MAG: BlaI/MecI/CopY family transcriptional regulator [Planctomycetes bacterium]|nr:BlaI/MecI/CopY family transcriptional regulator [Planctomycetota bacterium]